MCSIDRKNLYCMACSKLFLGLGMAGVYEIETPGPGGSQASTHYPPQITPGQLALSTLAQPVAAGLTFA